VSSPVGKENQNYGQNGAEITGKCYRKTPRRSTAAILKSSGRHFFPSASLSCPFSYPFNPAFCLFDGLDSAEV